MTPGSVTGLLLWGTLVGLDLVSLPQILLSRPLVAGTVAGWILGDLEAGMRVGVVFELFALGVLPVGAVRYPDYGAATLGAVAVLAGSSWSTALGPAVLLGLLLALLGGRSMDWVRRANARDVQLRTAGLAAGDAATIRALHWTGLGRDLLRSGGLTATALLAAEAVRRLGLPARTEFAPLTLLAVGGGIVAAASGALRRAGRGPRLRWLGAGLLAGALWSAVW